MAKKLKTVIGLVFDETGSMSSQARAACSAVNEFLGTVAREDPDAKVTLIQFSDVGELEERIRVDSRAVAATQIKKRGTANYRPRGITPLYDAVGSIIRELESQKADRYLVVVQTDGFENASRDFRREVVVEMVKEKEQSGEWTFTFLGAGIDAWALGASLGSVYAATSTLTSEDSARGYAATGQTLSASTESYLRSSKTQETDFIKKKTTT